MDDNKNINTKPLTKKEKADAAGRNAAEVAARGAGRYFGGSLGGAAVDAALKTKVGQKVIGQTGRMMNSSPITRNLPFFNKPNIRSAKSRTNSFMNSIGRSNGSSTSSMDDLSNSYDDNNTTTDVKGSGAVSGIWNKLPLKTKLIIIGIIAGLVFMVIFLIVLITPLMSLGIINIDGAGGTSGGSGMIGYTSVSQNSSHYWPIGSSETTTQNGVVYASGEPAVTTITSDYASYEEFRNNSHNGIDIGNGGNGPGVINIIATKDGTVIYPESTSQTSYADNGYYGNPDGGGFGNYVMISHNDGTITVYAHLAQNSITVLSGDIVNQGQVIGKMGNSGSSTGTHLHFEVRVNGNRVDPNGFVSVDNTRPKYSGINVINGNSVKQSVCLSLRSSGFSDNAVAALLTNINSESSFRLDADGDYENGEYTSYGLCQWHNTRKTELMSLYPNTYNTVGSQLEFLTYELKNDYSSLYYSLVRGTESAEDLTYNFCYSFERPADKSVTCDNRKNDTSEFLNYVKNGCN